ncbi:MAG: hypothetical protein R3D71_05950 [Rickettsiales bacterium]
MTVKVQNKGGRNIVHKEGVLKTGAFAILSDELAEKLISLYPDEVVSLETIFKEFEEKSEADENQEKTLDSLSINELREKAKELGIKVPHGSKAHDIVKLIETKHK